MSFQILSPNFDRLIWAHLTSDDEPYINRKLSENGMQWNSPWSKYMREIILCNFILVTISFKMLQKISNSWNFLEYETYPDNLLLKYKP